MEPAWFVDNNPTLWGKKLDGVEIRPVATLDDVGDRLVLVMSTHLLPMAQACITAGVKRWSWFTDIQEVFGDISIAIKAEKILAEPEIHRLSSLLAGSEESLITLKQALACRVTGDPKDLPPCRPGQYFVDEWVPDRYYARFVDCGAYNGDTLRDWINCKGNIFPPDQLQYHAFEPDPDNYAVLKRTVEDLPPHFTSHIVLHSAAVGDVSGTVKMIQGGAGTEIYHSSEAGMETQIVRLDDVLANEEIYAIKMDLEGFEPFALRGARTLLEKQRPVLMISVYHRPEHLWTLPLWINDLGLGYRLFLRHHDTTSSETVCYAVPPF